MNPKVSIIVCTYNREKFIGKCLDHLARQSLNTEEFEIIIVNNNSTDSTENVCKEFIESRSLKNFRYFLELNQGHSHSRNRGIKESKADLITFIDDDAFVTQDFAKNIIVFFEKNEAVKAIGGKIIPIFEGPVPGWMSSYLMPLVSALDLGKKEKPFSGRKFPIGANMTFRKTVFKEYGLFNVDLGRKGSGLEGGDEKEVFLRLKKDQQPIYYVPSVKVDHIIPQGRVEVSYIKGLAIGVGTSERKRISNKTIPEVPKKVIEEFYKSLATAALFLLFLLKGQVSKGWMLVKFRLWVQKGLIFNR